MPERSGHKRVRGIAMRVVVFLLLGAVVNVAVAWGCALWFPLPIAFSPTPIDCPDTWPAYLQDTWPAPARAEERIGHQQGIGSIGVSIIDIESEEKQPSAESPITDACLVVHCFGIPARSMQWEGRGLNAGRRSIEMLKAAFEAAGLRNGIRVASRQLSSQEPYGRRLPVTPIWPGFAINTVFYAAILWLLFAAPGSVRRWWRIRRGLCVKCAYPVGTSDVCTECGSVISGRRSARS